MSKYTWRALCKFVTKLHRFATEVSLQLLMTRFRQFRIGSFFWEIITPFVMHFDLCRPFTFTNSYITHYMKRNIQKSIIGALITALFTHFALLCPFEYPRSPWSKCGHIFHLAQRFRNRWPIAQSSCLWSPPHNPFPGKHRSTDHLRSGWHNHRNLFFSSSIASIFSSSNLFCEHCMLVWLHFGKTQVFKCVCL